MRITLLSVGVAIFLFLSLWLYKKNRNNTPITVLNTRKLYKKYYVTVALPVGGNRLYLFFTTCYVAWRLAWGKKKINCEAGGALTGTGKEYPTLIECIEFISLSVLGGIIGGIFGVCAMQILQLLRM
jgi:hypothetical protein